MFGGGVITKNYLIYTIWSVIQTEQGAAAAAAKSLQSCPTLCDPIEGGPSGSPVPGWGVSKVYICDFKNFQRCYIPIGFSGALGKIIL